MAISSHPSGALELTTNHWQLRLVLLLAVGSLGSAVLQTYDVVYFSDGMHTHFPARPFRDFAGDQGSAEQD
jgi:hypothetical protein